MFRIVLILAVALTYVGNYTAASAQTQPNLTEIKVATGEWPPFASEFYLAPFTSYGRAADIVKRVFLMAGYDAHFEFNRFGTSYQLARAGKVQAAFPYYRTSERKKEVQFSEPLLTVTDVIFYNSDLAPSLANAKTIEDLKPYVDQARFVESYCYSQQIRDAFGRICSSESKSKEVDERDLPA